MPPRFLPKTEYRVLHICYIMPYMAKRRLLLTIILIALSVGALLAGCQQRGLLPEDLPTLITDFDALATSELLTQNAPPPFFRDGVRLPRIDDGTEALSNWRAQVQIRFEGTFAGTTRQTSATADAEIWFTLLGTRRRVVLNVQGELLTAPSILEDQQRLEGVRYGQDVFIIENERCSPVNLDTAQNDSDSAAPAAAIIADLGAGELLGGVRDAKPNGKKAVINGSEVWGYGFLGDDLLLPSIIPQSGGAANMIGGELWFAPEHNAAIRYYLTVDVENAIVFGSQLPVTGQVVMRYDLFDIGVDPNITVPFGC